MPGSDFVPGDYSNLAPIQMGEAEPKEFPVANREEMEELWAEEEEAVMQAEFRML